MKIVIDVDKLLRENRITAEEYARLKGLASEDTTSMALNVLVGFGVIAVAGSTLALLQSVAATIPLGLVLAGLGIYLGTVVAKQWSLLGSIFVLVGSITAAGGIIALSDGKVPGLLAVTILFTVAAVLAKSGLLASMSALSVLATIGGMTGYGHAMYFLEIQHPSVTIGLFSLLAAVAYLVSKQLPFDYERIAIIFSRTCLFIVNLGFWIGSLWGDSPWTEDSVRQGLGSHQLIPDWVFAIGWAVGLLATGIWAVRRDKRFVVNLMATFGAIHFYTQWFERLGASPGTVLVAGLVAIAAAVGMVQFNRRVKAGGPVPQSE